MSVERVHSHPSRSARSRTPAVRLVLFDIDGTLLWTNGAGRRAMEAALVAIFGNPGPASYRYDGKTDRQIVRETMRASGIDDAVIDARMPDVEALYLERLALELAAPRTQVRAMAGVIDLLDAMRDLQQLVPGLLTGNLHAGAAQKLGAAGIAMQRFVVGAFGSDHERREELPPIARRRASDILGHNFPGEALVIIGDTPQDVACGQPLGARAIAVATGRYDVQELAACGPAAVFPDLRDTEAVLRAIHDA